MAHLALAGFLLLVPMLAWLSSQRQPHATLCCAAHHARDDLRMRSAYDTEPGIGPGNTTCDVPGDPT